MQVVAQVDGIDKGDLVDSAAQLGDFDFQVFFPTLVTQDRILFLQGFQFFFRVAQAAPR